MKWYLPHRPHGEDGPPVGIIEVEATSSSDAVEQARAQLPASHDLLYIARRI